MREYMCQEVMLKSEANSEGPVIGVTNKLKEDYVFEYLETQNMVCLNFF
jgi:hypothetical protein